MTHWMFQCSEVSQKVSQAMDAQLPFHHRMAVRVHLLMCRYCARFKKQLLLIRKMCHLDEHDAPDTPPMPNTLTPEARARIKAALRSTP